MRTYRRRTYARRPRRMRLAMRYPFAGFRQVERARMPFFVEYFLTPNPQTAAMVVARFTCNDIHKPDVTGPARTPTGYTRLSQRFANWIVVGSRLSLIATIQGIAGNPSTSIGQLVVARTNKATYGVGLISNQVTLMENNQRSGVVQCGGINNNQRTGGRITIAWSGRKWFGRAWDRDNPSLWGFSNVTGVSQAGGAFYEVIWSNISPGAPYQDLHISMKIDYLVEWFNPLPIQ